MTATHDWHPQDWIIIIEALATWAGPPEQVGPRGKRAYELIEAISEEHELRASELVQQADTEYFRG